MRFTSESVMNDIETALQSCPQEEWGDTERLLLKAQQHIAGLQRQLEAQTKPLSDEEIEKLANKLLSPYFCMYDNIQFARAIETKVRGEK